MSFTKRTTKVMSYKEQDDDDDFISAVDNTKKSRIIKSTESKSSTRQPPQKLDEKLSKSEEKQELDLGPKQSSKITPTELPVTIEDKVESTSCQLIISRHESKISSENVIDVDDQDENSLPKSKRMKHDEEDDTDKDESDSEEEEEPTPRKKIIYKTAETVKKTEMATMSSIDLDVPPTVTHIQQNSSTAISDLSNRTPSVPLGFPTSKIIIPSLHASRVGLSRKSSTIKPLHPNINSRLIHE